MALRDVIGWLVKHNIKELRHVFEPDPLAREVAARQDQLEKQLRERERRRDILRAQVQAMKGQSV